METPFHRLVEQCYLQFRAVYPDRYEPWYGFWRPAIDVAVEKFLECGDVQQGFARVRCPECAYEFFVAFSCHEKRALEKAGWVAEHICAEVLHRQVVFTMHQAVENHLDHIFSGHRHLTRPISQQTHLPTLTVLSHRFDQD